MKKYRCIICGHIYDEEKEGVLFESLPDNWTCPKCGVPKSMFEEVLDTVQEKDEDTTPSNAIVIDKDNVAIDRILEKCINCGICKNICLKREALDLGCNGKLCVNCGQCLQFCPTGAIISKSPWERIVKAKEEGKTLICYTSPSVRVALGDAFNMEAGLFMQEKLVGVLRMLGFDYVLDTTFGADLTIMEEASELISRINNKGVLPMFTSCCPSWVKYAEINYPGILKNISSCKSPIGMEGVMVKGYFADKNNLDSNKLFTVAVTPCTAKKFEIDRDEITGTDEVITIAELIDVIHNKNIKYDDIKESTYDKLLGEGSGAGVIFGNTGGVMEAALRTAYYMLTNKNLELDAIKFNEVRGMDNVKEAVIKIGDISLNVCVVNQMSSATPILEDVLNGKSKYEYIEIMNCYGGCIGGGGQPKHDSFMEKDVKESRIKSLYNRDDDSKIRFSHENPDIIKVYDEYLGKPLGEKSKELLHTKYFDKSDYKK